MTPEMNCALNEALNSSSLVAANCSFASSWRPNTRVNSWPAKDSSTCALSLPVCAHWATNCGWERFIIAPVKITAIGIVKIAMSVSVGEIHNIIASVPITVKMLVIIWLSVCCRDCAKLSRSFVVRDMISPRSWRSK